MLNNHLRFSVLYDKDPAKARMRILRFDVEASSVKHTYEGPWGAGGAFCVLSSLPFGRRTVACRHSISKPAAAFAAAAGTHTGRACLPLTLCMDSSTGKKPTLDTCDPDSETVVFHGDAPQPVEEGEEVIYTYDVVFQAT